MRTSFGVLPLLLLASLVTLTGCRTSSDSPVIPANAADLVIQSPPGTPRPPFSFSREDERLLDEVQQGAFWWMYDACDPTTGLTRDRSSASYSSIASIGFHLAALPIGVERGWITRRQGFDRALRILKTLEKTPRKEGLFYHFIDGTTAQIPPGSPEDAVSTIDSALLLSGMIVASSYFGGEVATLADRFVEDVNWTFFVDPQAEQPHWRGFISLAWKPENTGEPEGKGRLSPFYWIDAGDEQRLVTFLAVAAPHPERAIDPSVYYRLRRPIGVDEAGGPFSYIPWSGALFTHFFAHCFIHYAAIGADNPSAFGAERRARIDWWENSRRAVLMHQRKAELNPLGLPTLGRNAWGLTACDAASGYIVPGLYPTAHRFADERPDWEYETSPMAAREDYGDGTIAPYGAGCAILFTPDRAIDALRNYRSLRAPDGSPLVWRSPRPAKFDAPGPGEGYGFQDAFNLGTGWVAKDCIGIDQGPLALAIENARSGLIWRLFEAHPVVRNGFKRLGWR